MCNWWKLDDLYIFKNIVIRYIGIAGIWISFLGQVFFWHVKKVKKVKIWALGQKFLGNLSQCWPESTFLTSVTSFHSFHSKSRCLKWNYSIALRLCYTSVNFPMSSSRPQTTNCIVRSAVLLWIVRRQTDRPFLPDNVKKYLSLYCNKL